MSHLLNAVRATRLLAPAAFVLALIAAPAHAATCPNEGLRVLQGAPAGPLCRAYEQATPVDKGQGRVRPEAFAYGTADGTRIIYKVNGLFPDVPFASAPLNSRYESVAGPEGWTTYSTQPPSEQPPTPDNPTLLSPTVGESDDGTKALVGSNRALAPGAVDGYANIYVRDIVSGGYTTVSSSPEEGASATAISAYELFAGATPDFSKVLFNARAKLTPEAAGKVAGEAASNVYQWTADGGLELVSIVPNQSEPGGAPVAGGFASPEAHAISRDGRRIAFESEAQGSRNGIWLHEDGREEPIPVSSSELPGAPPGARPASLVKMTPDGETILFAAPNSEPLAAGVPEGGGNTLYRFDVESRTLTPLLSSSRGLVPTLTSEDCSYVYFESGEQFTPQGSPFGSTYVLHDGAVRFVQTPYFDPIYGAEGALTAVSPGGRYFVFGTIAAPTGYDNRTTTGRCRNNPAIPVFNGLCREIYLFDADAAAGQEVRCLSCGSPSEEALGPAGIGSNPGDRSQLVHRPRVAFDDGSIYFDSAQSLVPEDVNGTTDVYEFHEGITSLISRGTRDATSQLAEVSADERSIFFTSDDPIVAQDTDRLNDMYVARAEGGIAAQNVLPTPNGECAASACPPAGAVAPVATAPGSERTGGPGNLRPGRRCVPPKRRAKDGRARRSKGRHRQCVRRHRRPHHKRAPRRVVHNRGGAA